MSKTGSRRTPYYPLLCACCGVREDQCDCRYRPEGGCETHHVVECWHLHRYDYRIGNDCPDCERDRGVRERSRAVTPTPLFQATLFGEETA